MAKIPTKDPIGPKYYKRGKTDVWDFIRDQSLNFHLGNAVKYICRAGFKDNKVEDLRKAIHYLQNELQYTNTSRASTRVSEVLPYPQFEDGFTEISSERSDRRGI